jgi:transcriptional regulator with XRE-family HTH domain
MELHEKLQQLRKQKGLTQEELAEKLYVSRTAISKWESGRGYPSIDSLKAIAKFFSISIDILLSGDEILNLAEEDQRQSKHSFCSLIFGSLDLSTAMLLFLPFFAEKGAYPIRCVSLLLLSGVQPYLKTLFLILVSAAAAFGVLTLGLQNCQHSLWLRSKNIISFSVSIAGVLLFIIGLQPYAAVFFFVLLTIKAFIVFKKA